MFNEGNTRLSYIDCSKDFINDMLIFTYFIFSKMSIDIYSIISKHCNTILCLMNYIVLLEISNINWLFIKGFQES